MTALLLVFLLPADKTNVVILADALGLADLGRYGSKYHTTPNLDRLGKEGLRFTHGYAACPPSSPRLRGAVKILKEFNGKISHSPREK